MKKPSDKARNPYAQEAAKRKGGAMKPKRDKRKKSKDQQISEEIDNG